MILPRTFQSYPGGGPLSLDGLKAVCWEILLAPAGTSARVKNISPGELYTFILVQNDQGDNFWQWPANCINAAGIDPTPYSVTVQNFIGLTGGYLYANAPGAWTETGEPIS